MKKVLIATVISLASGVSAPAATTATCGELAVKVIASDLNSVTNITEPNFKPVSDTAMSFVQGGTAPGCVMVHFSAELSGSPVIRAVLDNTILGLPNEVRLDTQDADVTARSFLFIFTGIAPGRHNVRLEFRGQFGESNQLRKKNTAVMYVP